MRINKYLASCNLGSRRQAEELILQGKIKVNGELCLDLATDIKPGEDEVTCDGKPVSQVKKKIYLALNKPRGYIVTRSDEYNRKTVFDMLPSFDVNLFSVGRLDKDSEGLLLLTNDGDFADRIMHPRYKLPKVYKVEIKGKIMPEDLKRLQQGMVIEGEQTLTARVFVKKRGDETSVLRFTIYEGKNRQIRKMVESLGYKVINLRRLQIDGIKLDDLPSGMFRPLRPSEIRSILSDTAGSGKRPQTRSRKTGDREKYKVSNKRKRRDAERAGRNERGSRARGYKTQQDKLTRED